MKKVRSLSRGSSGVDSTSKPKTMLDLIRDDITNAQIRGMENTLLNGDISHNVFHGIYKEIKADGVTSPINDPHL